MSNHSIIISSSLCKDTFPDNHGGEFSNYLNRSLEFDEPHEQLSVALSEIVYTPDSWMNVREGFNEIKVSINNFKALNAYANIYYDELVVQPVRNNAVDELLDYNPQSPRPRDPGDEGSSSVLQPFGKSVKVYEYTFTFYN